ncbi:MAG: hypothetical protein QM691_12970 [Opitutaceae bacterium]
MIRHRVSHRNTALRPPREILARLAFAAYVLALPAGVLAFAWGTTHGRPAWQIAGGAAGAVFAALHFFARQPLGFSAVVQDLKRNPFKAAAASCPSGDEAPACRCTGNR